MRRANGLLHARLRQRNVWRHALHVRRATVLDGQSVLQRELQRRRVSAAEPLVPNSRQLLLDERRVLLEAVQQRDL